MIPQIQARDVRSSCDGDAAAFDISAKDTAHVMGILRDQLYSDKVAAVIREYSSNAWDAHREAEKPDLPIRVTLPTSTHLVFEVRDFGLGLSHEDVFGVFTQYGASTKRGSNVAVGMLGIGSKSGFAYSDSFVVKSWHGGRRRTYVAVLDESERGQIKLLDDVECSETGLAIQIAVRPGDVDEFRNKARRFFATFEPRPDVNLDLPPAAATTLSRGTILPQSDGWTALMGCVPYRVDLDQLVRSSGGPGIADFVRRIGGLLRFDIGALQVSASREELKYGERTKKALATGIEALCDEYVADAVKAILSGAFSEWEKHIRAQALRQFKLPALDAVASLLRGEVSLPGGYVAFSLACYRYNDRGRAALSSPHSVVIDSRTRFVVRDDDRALSGYRLSPLDYLVRVEKGRHVDDAEGELQVLLARLNLVGVPVNRASTLDWTAPTRPERATGVARRQHKVRQFVFKPKNRSRRERDSQIAYEYPYSDHWEPIERVPQDDDVFVVLTSFRAFGLDFYTDAAGDALALEAFGLTLPPIYGYKSTDKQPQKGHGVDYATWRQRLGRELLKSPAARELLEHYVWANTFGNFNNNILRLYEVDLLSIVTSLGEGHEVVALLQRFRTAEVAWRAATPNQESAIRRVRPATLCPEVQARRDEVAAKYPLLFAQAMQISALWGPHAGEWINYVKEKSK